MHVIKSEICTQSLVDYFSCAVGTIIFTMFLVDFVNTISNTEFKAAQKISKCNHGHVSRVVEADCKHSCVDTFCKQS